MRSPHHTAVKPRKARPFRSILVPLDGSPLAEQAIPHALEIARVARSKVRLVLVHQSPAPPLNTDSARLYVSIDLAVREAGREYLTGLAARLRDTSGLPISAVWIDGPTGPALVEYVRNVGVDLVAMTTHGRGGPHRAWVGSVVDHLLRRLTIPVLVVRARKDATSVVAPSKPRDILVPLDGSPRAEAALAPASALAGLLDAELLLVQVVHPLSDGAMLPVPFAAGYDAEIMALERKETQAYLESLAEKLRQQGARARAMVVEGHHVVEALLDLAHRTRVDLVALATHGRGGVQRLLLGSVADKVIRTAETPVLVVRPGK